MALDPGLQSHGLYAALIRDAPWLASEPRQLDGAQVAAVADPVAVSRAWALQLLLDAADLSPPTAEAAPRGCSRPCTLAGRFWGDDLKKAHRLTLNQAVLDWSRYRSRGTARRRPQDRSQQIDRRGPRRQRLMELLTAETNPNGRRSAAIYWTSCSHARPQALVEAVQIINDHRDLSRDGDDSVRLHRPLFDRRLSWIAIFGGNRSRANLIRDGRALDRPARSRLEPWQPALGQKGKRSTPSEPQYGAAVETLPSRKLASRVADHPGERLRRA